MSVLRVLEPEPDPLPWLIYALTEELEPLNRVVALARLAALHRPITVVGSSPYIHCMQRSIESAPITFKAIAPQADLQSIRSYFYCLAVCPAVLVVEALPTGLRGELVGMLPLLKATPRILIQRDLPSEDLTGQALEFVSRYYDLVLVPGQEEATTLSLPHTRVTAPWYTRSESDSPRSQLLLRLDLEEDPLSPTIVVWASGNQPELDWYGSLVTSLKQSFPWVTVRLLSPLLPQTCPLSLWVAHWPEVDCLPAADLVIGGADYSTIYECLAVGLPLITVPWPRQFDQQQLRAERIAQVFGSVSLATSRQDVIGQVCQWLDLVMTHHWVPPQPQPFVNGIVEALMLIETQIKIKGEQVYHQAMAREWQHLAQLQPGDLDQTRVFFNNAGPTLKDLKNKDLKIDQTAIKPATDSPIDTSAQTIPVAPMESFSDSVQSVPAMGALAIYEEPAGVESIIFIIMVADEGPDQLKWCLSHLRKAYPTAAVQVISDGVDLDYNPICRAYDANYQFGEFLKRMEAGGLWWHRLLALGLEANTDWIVKMDPDTCLHRPLQDWPTEPGVYGTQLKGFGTYFIQGGFQIIHREIAHQLLGLMLAPQHRGLVPNPFKDRSDTEVALEFHAFGYCSSDYILCRCLEMLKLPTFNLKEVGCYWKQAPFNAQADYAVTHPHKCPVYYPEAVDRSLTIVVTCKDRLDHLKLSLPSFLQQNVSVVVVDYACPQATGAWVTAHYPEVKVVNVTDQSDFHLARARNAGARVVTSTWIAFLDADLLLEPHWMACLALRPGYYFVPMPAKLSMTGCCVVEQSIWQQVGGYDEVIQGWGGDDLGFYLFCRAIGIRPAGWDSATAHVLEHTDEQRTRYYAEKDKEVTNLRTRRYLDYLGRWIVANKGIPPVQIRQKYYGMAHQDFTGSDAQSHWVSH